MSDETEPDEKKPIRVALEEIALMARDPFALVRPNLSQEMKATEVGTFSSERDRLESLGYENLGSGMSNFDHVIDDGFEDRLRAGDCWGQYAAWNFNGAVWFDGERFACEVWVYRSPREVVRADSLKEIMDEVSTRYGAG